MDPFIDYMDSPKDCHGTPHGLHGFPYIMDPLLDFPHRCHGSPYRFSLDYRDPFIGYMVPPIDCHGSPFRFHGSPSRSPGFPFGFPS